RIDLIKETEKIGTENLITPTSKETIVAVTPHQNRHSKNLVVVDLKGNQIDLIKETEKIETENLITLILKRKVEALREMEELHLRNLEIKNLKTQGIVRWV